MNNESIAFQSSDSSSNSLTSCNIVSLPEFLQDPFSSIDDMYARLICLDDYFLVHEDYLLYFNNIYLQMTRLIRERILIGSYFELPDWMRYYTAHFGNFYRQALYNFLTGNIKDVPLCWRLAFKHAHKRDLTILFHIALGMNAHIVRDLGITLSELDPAGANTTAKKSDSQNVNGVLHSDALSITAAFSDFYAPIIDLTKWETLLNTVLDTLIDILRTISWHEGMFIATHPATKETLSHIMDTVAWLLGNTFVVIDPLFQSIKEYERSFPFKHFCAIVPWGCGSNHK